MSLTQQSDRRSKRNWKKWQIGIVIFVLCLIVIRSSIADWSLVPTGSMSPTIVEGDIVWNNKLAYDFRIPFTPWKISRNDPERGEIAVFKSPENGTTLVKRVIALPGDTLSMKHGVLSINGQPINHAPLPRETFEKVSPKFLAYADFWQEILGEGPHSIMMIPGAPLILRNIPPITVPEGRYFMLGDNRDFSRDSRMYGFVARDHFLGRATNVLLSFRQGENFQLRNDRFLEALR